MHIPVPSQAGTVVHNIFDRHRKRVWPGKSFPYFNNGGQHWDKKKAPSGAFGHFDFLYLLISSWSCRLIFCSLSKARLL